jgi:AcrR family transcriptional regulator
MNRKVSREQWIEAALAALGEAGLAALAIEPLARRLGVTKGSFYSHFQGLDAFVTAVLGFWERVATEQVIERLEGVGQPAERLKGLFELVWARTDHLKIEAALLAGAVAGDARVRPIYLRVNRRRLGYTTQLYRALGLGDEEARRHATTAYGSYLGTLLLVALEGSTFRSQAELCEHARHMAELLVPSLSAPLR